MRLHRPAAVALAALLLVTPGCLDGADDAQPPDGDGNGDGSDRHTYQDCDALDFTYESNGTTWHAARVSCDANVTGTNRQAIPCPSPDEAEVTAATNLKAGTIRLVVRDGANESVVDRRISDTDGQPHKLDVAGGQPGNWTLSVERLEDYWGTFQSELACPE